MGTDSSCGNTPTDSFDFVCMRAGGVVIRLQRLDKVNPQMELVERSGSRKNQGYVSPHTGRVLSCCVFAQEKVLVFSGAGEAGTEACPSLQRIYPITTGEWQPSPGGQGWGCHWPVFMTEKRSIRELMLMAEYTCHQHLMPNPPFEGLGIVKGRIKIK